MHSNKTKLGTEIDLNKQTTTCEIQCRYKISNMYTICMFDVHRNWAMHVRITSFKKLKCQYFLIIHTISYNTSSYFKLTWHARRVIVIFSYNLKSAVCRWNPSFVNIFKNILSHNHAKWNQSWPQSSAVCSLQMHLMVTSPDKVKN